MGTHNLCFRAEIRKIITWYPLLSRPMLNHHLFILHINNIIAPDRWWSPHNIFPTSPWKHLLWVLIRSASVRRLVRNKKNIKTVFEKKKKKALCGTMTYTDSLILDNIYIKLEKMYPWIAALYTNSCSLFGCQCTLSVVNTLSIGCQCTLYQLTMHSLLVVNAL